MRIIMRPVLLLFSCALLLHLATIGPTEAFFTATAPAVATAPAIAARSQANTRGVVGHLNMVKFDGEKWVAEKPEETGEAGYPLLNTWFLHGPKPFFTRVFQPNDYEQAVLKFMAGDKCDRKTAMGNMDAFMNNPSDWAFSRLEEKRRGIKYDYATLDPKQVILVSVWSVLIFALVGRAIYAYLYNVPFDDEFSARPNLYSADRSSVEGTIANHSRSTATKN